MAVALIIGTIELIGVLAEQANINSGPLAAIANIPLDYAGYVIIALFFVGWIGALAIWRFGRVEQKWSANMRVSEEFRTVTPDSASDPKPPLD